MSEEETNVDEEDISVMETYSEMNQLLKYSLLPVFLSLLASRPFPDGFISLPYEDPEILQVIELASSIGGIIASLLLLVSLAFIIVYRFRAKNAVKSGETYPNTILNRDLQIVSTSLLMGSSALIVLTIFGFSPI